MVGAAGGTLLRNIDQGNGGPPERSRNHCIMNDTNDEAVSFTREQVEFEKASAVQEYRLARQVKVLEDRECLLNQKELIIRKSELRLRRWLQMFSVTVIAAAIMFVSYATVAFLNVISTRDLQDMSKQQAQIFNLIKNMNAPDTNTVTQNKEENTDDQQGVNTDDQQGDLNKQAITSEKKKLATKKRK
jgi:hypothetical protein